MPSFTLPTRRNILQLLLVLFCACSFTSAQSSPPQFTISGTVVSSLTGAPLKQARVLLTDTSNSANRLSVITAENGQFVFIPVYRGKFSLSGAKRGFISAAYDQHEEFSTAIVTGAGFNTEHLILRLTPLALLSGKVIDETGDPVRNAQITLYVEQHGPEANRVVPAGGTQTDDQGYYEFAALAPGSYFVCAAAKPWYAIHAATNPRSSNLARQKIDPALDVAYPATFSDGATDSQSASPIAIRGGDHLQADIHLSPVPVVHLVFHVPEEAGQGFRLPTFQTRIFDSEQAVQPDMQSTAPDIFEISGLPAGKYSVALSDAQSGQPMPSSEISFLKDGEFQASQSEPSAAVKFLVNLPAQQPIPKNLFIGMQDSHKRVISAKGVDSAGHVSFDSLPAGKYVIVAFSPAKPLAVVRTLTSTTESPGHDLTLTPGSSPEVTLFLATGVVTVEGFVHHGDQPASGVMVILVPKDPQSHLEFFRRDQSDLDGSFAVRNVIPGTYTLIAVDDAWNFQWRQPATLTRYLQHGQNLVVGDLMTNSVHLPDPVQVQPR
jgi:hypothetical protein